MIAALASLMDALATFLAPVAISQLSVPPADSNDYTLPVSSATPAGANLPFASSYYVTALRFAAPNANATPPNPNYAISADVVESNEGSNTLRLFGGSIDAIAFQPSLSLRRNDTIPKDLNMPSLQTNPKLVYVSGPVLWPQPVSVSNSWLILPVNNASGRALVDILTEILGGLFGATADLSTITLRLALKHAFNLLPDNAAMLIVENPANLFPADYSYSSVSKLAGDIVDAYSAFLTLEGGTVAANLAQISSPRLRLGLQACQGNVNPPNAPVTHVLLEIDAIEIPTDHLTWPS